MRERSDDKVGRAEQQHDEQGELQPDDPLDAGGVDQGEEGDDDGGHGALRQRAVVGRQQAGDGLAEAGGAQGVADGLWRLGRLVEKVTGFFRCDWGRVLALLRA